MITKKIKIPYKLRNRRDVVYSQDVIGGATTSATTASATVGGSRSTSLSELTDVDLSSVQDKDFLSYNSSNNRWENDPRSDIAYKDIANTFTEDQTIQADLYIEGDIYQNGDAYETHAEELYTTKDFIIQRDGAESAIASGEIAGSKIMKADGTNNVIFGTGPDAIARIGWEDDVLQAIATREDSPTNNGHAYWSDSDNMFLTRAAAFDSDKLGGHEAGDYTRRDQDETITGKWTFENNVSVGDKEGLRVTIRNNDVRFNRDDAVGYIGNAGTGGLGFRTGGWDVKMVLDENGNLGIGTLSPSRRLVVNGTGRFNDSLYLDDTIGTDNFESQTKGWRGNYDGEFDVRYLYTDELRAQAFTADVSQALAGSDFLTWSVTKLAEGFTIPATGSTGQMVVEDLEGQEGVACFEDDDWIRLRIFDRSGGGKVIANVWGKVVLDTSYGTDGFASDNTQAYTFTCEDSGGVDELKANKGSEVLDYGQSGAGFIERTVLDEAGAPYSQIVKWTSDPSDSDNYEVLTRWGVLDGIPNASKSGLYGKRTFLTEYLLAGDLTKDNNYLEYDEGVLNIDAEQFNLKAGSDYWRTEDNHFRFGGSDGISYDGSQIKIGSDVLIDGADIAVNSLPVVSDEGLVGLWRFENSTLNNHTGSEGDVNGNIEYVSGISGRAIDFSNDSSSYVVDESIDYTIGTGDFSLSLTFQCNLSRTSHPINIGSRALGSSVGDNITVWVRDDGDLVVALRDESDTGNVDTLELSNYVSSDKIYTICFLRKNGVVSLYVNGKFEKETNSDLSINNDNIVIFGMRDDLDDDSFDGWVDEVRFYSRALSKREIKSLALNPSGNVGGRISANQVRTGELISQNWDEDDSNPEKGTRFDLNNGLLEMRYNNETIFKFDSEDESAQIAGFGFDTDKFYSDNEDIVIDGKNRIISIDTASTHGRFVLLDQGTKYGEFSEGGLTFDGKAGGHQVHWVEDLDGDNYTEVGHIYAYQDSYTSNDVINKLVVRCQSAGIDESQIYLTATNVLIPALPDSDPFIYGGLFYQTASQLGGSGDTRVVCVSDTDLSEPATPDKPDACKGSDNMIKISTNDVTDAEEYVFERSVDDDSSWEGFKTASEPTVYDGDPQTNENTSYYYRVKAKNKAGDSGWSDTSDAVVYTQEGPCS